MINKINYNKSLILRKFFPPAKYHYNSSKLIIPELFIKLNKNINKISELCHIWIRNNF
jgi:hypothetical protein